MSTLLCFMCHEMAVHPEIQQRLFDEVMAIDEQLEGKPATYETIQGFKYMDMIVNETLRKWPPIPGTDRQVTKPYTIQISGNRQIHLETNDVVWLPVLALHMDPQYWSEPERFDPERFNDENKKNIRPGTFTPFGTGQRACIASRFALLVAKTVFYTIIRTYRIEQCPRTPNPIKVQRNTINTKAEGGFWVRLRPSKMPSKIPSTAL